MRLQLLILAIIPLTLAAAKCECPLVNCLGDELARCQCANEAAIRCAAGCFIKPITRQCPTPTSTKPAPLPSSTPCGGLDNKPCAKNQTCIPNPKKPGCSPLVDCPGICVQLDGPKCAGFTGLQCPKSDQVCVDDPRDSCGGVGSADCIGVCVRLDGGSSA